MEQLLGQFSLGLFILQIILFVGLILLLKKFAWKPILDAVNEREDGIKNALLSAENARTEMQNLQADNQRILQEARLERDNMLKDAREIKEKMIADSKTEAQAQGIKMIEQAKAAIESEKNAAMAELKSQVSNLSIEIAEKLLKDELSNKDAQTKLVEKMLGDVKLN
ncbi:ATP F0F1 synthase subunit B [Flavobacterium psychrophilum]|jgi:F-type H+-transporting ATPase subunit b|uniref:ATP synthase subunit b n=3 Tax=Flavobacterium psychrophilum TaxID=96345 RepID=ATPF_FLAPJ|nr:F0F1 ATP synthase subunit B [Flavobacterium psychrophilum]A6H2D9.1 RecName: Full=ATP synthase subunit b; AltName: Full=ATP synthase F(0) sector subunit b; AltName: Full=ATPase subunit I; AltName: Full=F-type ATPase subunit b; Short=F-ATPase subunit b [Flavobacterium psychrophilum JIP02/86]AIG31182.1 ATP F0F1 synthase subunit B [Flavobacterium psychrophilum]AIG33459.1 ATP F0F1 synthase subunit B [Flavobacterium psychrophilum]AIG35610.1 ATP F0F1 synthase subunit B [Flavobacterium psychrophilum